LYIVGSIGGWTGKHVFQAFKPHDVPSISLAEVVLSKLSSICRRNKTLLEAARQDVALAIRQEVDLQYFTDGYAVRGRELTSMQRRFKIFDDTKLAAAFDEALQQNILPPKQSAPFILVGD
jgi:hypothetical protein